jgi:glycosyltransferase involved in cell wall biosynthesis
LSGPAAPGSTDLAGGAARPTPLCSVIVPLYKHEAFVAECLESVRNQHSTRMELILVDDCSPDQSYAKALAYLSQPESAARFERIVTEAKRTNRGAHDSLNRGLALARGDYIAIINSDDRFAPRRLVTMIDAMQAANARFAYSAVHAFSTTPKVPHEGFQKLLQFIDFIAPQLPSRSFAYLGNNCALTTGNFVMTRDFAHIVGEFANLQLTHDWDWLLRATIHEEPLFVAERLYDYRLHDANTFASVQAKAAVESQVCVTRYLQQIAAAPPPNALCPNPHHWPGLFEHNLRCWGWESLWWQIAHGHQPLGRTERPRTWQRPFHP